MGAPAIDDSVVTASARLAAAVGAAKGADPLAPVTVVAPTAAAGPSLRRAVVGAMGGVVNLRVASVVELARLLTSGGDAGGRPLGPAVRQRLVADVASSAGMGHPATVAALAARFRELRWCSPAARDALAAVRRAATVVGLYEAYRRRMLEGGWVDDADAVEAATARLRAGDAGALAVARQEIGRVVVHLPHPRRPWVEAGLVDALAATVGVDVVEAISAESRPTKTVVAPDPEAEVRLAAGEVLRIARGGVAFARIAVVHPGRPPYPRLVGELLDVAGIPWGGPAGGAVTTGTESVTGRVLLAALRAPLEEWSRVAVMDVLAGGPVVAASVRAAWEAAARDANVVAGLAAWRSRVRARDASLAAWVDDLAARVEDVHLAAGTSWAAVADAVAALGEWLLPTGASDRGAVAVAAAERDVELRVALDGDLRVLDAVSPPRGYGDAVDAVAAAVERSASWRAAADGVLVAPVAEAVGVDVDAVVAVGMNEGMFPARRRDDPLLPDRVRAVTGGELPTRAERRASDLRGLSLVLGTARVDRVVCAARADQRAQQARRPSPWLPFAPPASAPASPGPERDEPPSFLAAALGRPAVTSQELALQLLARRPRDPARFGPALARGFEAIAARRSTAVTVWDGAVGAHPHLVVGAAPMAPTTLEVWARCPFQYFARSVLRVAETVVPEERVGMDARDRGTLVHAVLEQLVTARLAAERADVAFDEPGELARIVGEVCAAYEDAGLVGRRLSWLLERRTLEADLAAVLALDRVERDAGLRPVLAEVAFGDARDDASLPAVEVARRRPAADGSGAVRFRGRIDRVDASADGTRARVTDYKTGRSDYYRRDLEPKRGQERVADPTAAGTRLQLPVYAMAVRERFPDAEVRAEYWFVTDAPRGYPRVAVELDAATATRVEEVVSHVADSVEAGAFPPRPGEAVLDSWQQCRRCAYDEVCSADRGDAAERKREDEAVVRFLGLRVEDRP